MRPPGLRDDVVYLDHNATTPVDPRVAEAARPYIETHFGNPSTTGAYAEAPRRALHEARGHVAELIGAEPGEIVFTSGGSESDVLALRGPALAPDDHLITQVTEHPAVLRTCAALERAGVRVTLLSVDRFGLVEPAELRRTLTPQTRLVSVMLANGETGTIQPVAELAAIAREHGALFHTDAAQAVGKIPVSVTDLGVDLLTIAGHKLYAPKGIGALYVRRGLTLEPLISGGGQEDGRRSGTENVAFAVALGEAARLASESLDVEAARIVELRDRLHNRLGEVQLNGHPDHRLPGTLNVSLPGVVGRDLLAGLPELVAATGSACHTGDPEPSAVLTAMGLDRDRALAAIRLSLGRWTTGAEIDHAAALLTQR
ncbi:cysteine desulfurase [Herbidospora galbida]|uniref:cysteine desulfurase n=1 Tax=Herbidospora galbida TaxID=2575442 RepID=A0A4U3MSD0_9ACTN|nr:cysteine desulfurase family protein [Herbidospora galbida]TKK91337.1 cysteine desulfurase [Herbidospora galbida]